MPLDQWRAVSGAELTVVVPSFNERENVRPLIERIAAALNGIEWELIFVDDDSPDGTAREIRDVARTSLRVRCLQRIGRRGLSTAVIEGMLASSAKYLAVIDGDLQHDETLLPKMLATLRSEPLDIVIGSRHIEGGGIGEWSKKRAAISRFATTLARVVVSCELSDPMSGFFMITREAFERSVRNLSGQGFKILLDLFASSPMSLRFQEFPYTFRTRLHGESKLDSFVAWEYLMLLLDKTVGRYVPVRFAMFGAVGAVGVVIHLVTLRLLLMTPLSFPISQVLATVIAMSNNFVMNNMLTYSDKRLRGLKFIVGLLSFYAICSIGAVANVGIASAVFDRHYAWWLSGMAGAVVGVVWNYAASSIFTWKRR